MREFSKFLCHVVVLLVLMSCSAFAQGLLVAWQPGTAVWKLDWRDPATGEQVVYTGRLVHEADDQQLLAYPVLEREPLLALMRSLRLHPDVIYVERNAPIQMQSNWPTHFPSLGLDVSWPIRLKCNGVALAIIDTGVDQTHPALQGVGFRPDKNYPNPPDAGVQDDVGHGTHIAGLIAAHPGVEPGVAGVCDQADLLSIRFMRQSGSEVVGDVADAAAALRYAADQGVAVINASWAGSFSETLEQAVEYATQSDVLIVAAAGNAYQDLDQLPSYPASLAAGNSRVLAIANAKTTGGLYTASSGSNYGYSQVSLAAPGTDLKSTWPGGNYEYRTGTSMAAPLAAAGLAALATRFPNATPETLHAALLNTVQLDNQLQGKMRYPGVPDLSLIDSADDASLLRPTWLRYEWDPYVDRLVFSGVGLDQVEKAWLDFPDVSEVSEDLTLDRLGETQLGVSLPTGWESATLYLQDDQGRELQSVQLPAILDAAPVGEMSRCTGSQCTIQLADRRVTVSRDYPETEWWLSTQQQDEREVLVITGQKLNDSWQVQVAGHPRLQLSQVWARNASEQWVQLGAAEGYVRRNAQRFEWVVDAIADWSVEASPQRLLLDIQTQVPSSGGCFIASHVYGSATAPEVESLRVFRDQVLMSSVPGRWLVQQYYRVSPGLVDWMADKPRLTRMVKWLLDGWVAVWQKWLA